MKYINYVLWYSDIWYSDFYLFITKILPNKFNKLRYINAKVTENFLICGQWYDMV